MGHLLILPLGIMSVAFDFEEFKVMTLVYLKRKCRLWLIQYFCTIKEKNVLQVSLVPL